MINQKHNKTFLSQDSDEIHAIQWKCGIHDKTNYGSGFSIIADFTITNGCGEVLIDFDIDSMKLEVAGGMGSSNAYDVVMEKADVLEREVAAFCSHLRECAEQMKLKNEVLEV